MSFFSSSSLKNSLSLPIQNSVSDFAGAAVSKATDMIGGGFQKIKDFASAGNPLKQAEALLKMKDSGISPEFDSLTRRMDIVKAGGSVVAADKTTKSPIATIGVLQTGRPSPSMVQDANPDNTEFFKVKLWQDPALDGNGGAADMVTFDVMPTIGESRQATYDTFTPLHHPGEILKFKSTGARSWTISAKLISRNQEEASKNLRSINTIRSWVMPFYGEGTKANSATGQYLGAPPPILTLQAYGDQMIGPVKCVLENYDWRFPNDVDYIPTYSGVPFPVILEVALTVKESWSPAEYSGFDLMKYRNGKLPDAFTAVTANQQQQNTASQVVAPRPDVPNRSEPVTAPAVPSTAKQETSALNKNGSSLTGADRVAEMTSEGNPGAIGIPI